MNNAAADTTWIDEIGKSAYERVADLVKVLDDSRDSEAQDPQEKAIEAILQDPLSVRVFGERTNGEWAATNYEILLGTGGPAMRIVGDLNEHGEPDSARLEVQDWGKPWTEYFRADSEVLLEYAQCFYFAE
jgi:hypothetical protein